MKNITSEQIDGIINEAFLMVNEDIPLNFAESVEKYEEAFKEFDCLRNTGMYFAAFKTAQDNCVEILRKTLKELLCEQ